MLPATAAEIAALLDHSERRADTTVHSGLAPIYGSDGYSFMANLPRTWIVVPQWGDWPYLIGWRHDRDRAVLTYCEGDLDVEIADDHKSYVRLLHRTVKHIAASPDDGAAFLAWLDKTLGHNRSVALTTSALAVQSE